MNDGWIIFFQPGGEENDKYLAIEMKLLGYIICNV